MTGRKNWRMAPRLLVSIYWRLKLFSNNPSTADDHITVKENSGLAGSNRALRLIEGHENLDRLRFFSIIAAAGS